jgi:molecular chaperone GrpE
MDKELHTMQDPNKPELEAYEQAARAGDEAGQAPEVEPTADDATEDAGTERMPKFEELIRAAERRAEEHHDAWLRAKAETENVRRRAEDDVAKAAKFAAEKFAGAMLPVRDSLEAALNTENQTVESLREGVELTLRQLVSAFDGANIVEENPIDAKFDPNRHQAIGTLESDAEPNTVVQVLQKGYLIHDRVLRPALVMVSKGK